MQSSFRQSMTWLHTWAGLVFCWVLYFIFITGTVGYFDTEIDQWMQPELHRGKPVEAVKQVAIAEAWLTKHAPHADEWFIFPRNKRETLYLNARAFTKGKESIEQSFNAETGEPLAKARETGGGETLYRMHYVLHYIPGKIAYRLVGVMTFLMFLGLITGIIIHKKIFADFFTFRPRKFKRTWLDLHNLLSVTSLPFQLMITYSGLIFMLTTWMPMIGIASYGFDEAKIRAVFAEMQGDIHVTRSGTITKMLPMSHFVNAAAPVLDLNDVRHVKVKYPNDANAIVRVTINNQTIDRFRANMVFNAQDGSLIQQQLSDPIPPSVVSNTFLGLHEGLFAGIYLRWLYFISGLLGAGMIATGAIFWVAKRQDKIDASPNHFGYKLVNALNIGTIIGLPAAVGAYFLANRLLPIGMHARAEWEVHCMFIVWLLAIIHPGLRSSKQAWFEQTCIAAIILAAIPIVNAITTDRGLFNSLQQQDWVFVSVDLTAIIFAIICAGAAWVMHKRQGQGA